MLDGVKVRTVSKQLQVNDISKLHILPLEVEESWPGARSLSLLLDWSPKVEAWQKHGAQENIPPWALCAHCSVALLQVQLTVLTA